MYEIKIKIENKINEFTIEELKQLKEVLEMFKKIDEFHLECKKEGSSKVK